MKRTSFAGDYVLQSPTIDRKERSKKISLIIEIIAALFILLFVYTALSKIANFNTFRYQLTVYPFINKAASFVSWFVPASELLVAALLFIPRTKSIGLYSSLLLMTGFTVYLVLMIIFGGKDLPCSCGGVVQALSWKQHIIFNSIFISLAIFAIRLSRGKAKHDNA